MKFVRKRLTRRSWSVWLILATLAAVLCGTGLYPVIRKDLTLDRIESLGGDFYSDHYQSIGWLPLQWRGRINDAISPLMSLLFGEKWAGRFKRINGVDLRDTKATDDDLRCLGNLRDLNWLWLAEIGITDEGLVHLSGLSPDNYIHLNGTGITGKGLIHLSGMNQLVDLDLSDTKVDDDGIRHLRRLTGLRSLNLTGTRVTEEGITELGNSLPRCRIFNWSHLN